MHATADRVVVPKVWSGSTILLAVSPAGIDVAVNAFSLRDECDYLMCAERLAWGYVDRPPPIAPVTAAARALLGDALVPSACYPR